MKVTYVQRTIIVRSAYNPKDYESVKTAGDAVTKVTGKFEEAAREGLPENVVVDVGKIEMVAI